MGDKKRARISTGLSGGERCRSHENGPPEESSGPLSSN